MPDWPEEARIAALAALDSRAMADGLDITVQQSWQLVTDILDAAAPILGEHIAQAILAHMDAHGPPGGTQRYIYRSHFGTAARVAASALLTEEDVKRLAAEAIARGDYAVCEIPEPGDG